MSKYLTAGETTHYQRTWLTIRAQDAEAKAAEKARKAAEKKQLEEEESAGAKRVCASSHLAH